MANTTGLRRFETVISKARFVNHGYTGEQMARAASALVDRGILPRIRRGLDVNDSQAPDLKPGYAKQKARRGRNPIRDWTYTGRTLRSLKVLSAGPNRAVIGFTDAVANRRAAINNRKHRQFGVSPSDGKVLGKEFTQLGSPVRAEAA